MAARKLDMNHGFIKSIVKNQVARDQYNTEMLEKQSQQTKPTKSFSRQPAAAGSAAGRARKPDQNFYRPPHFRSKDSDPSPSETEILFKLEYADEVGKIHSYDVNKSDEPSSLSRKLAADVGLSPELTTALENWLREV